MLNDRCMQSCNMSANFHSVSHDKCVDWLAEVRLWSAVQGSSRMLYLPQHVHVVSIKLALRWWNIDLETCFYNSSRDRNKAYHSKFKRQSPTIIVDVSRQVATCSYKQFVMWTEKKLAWLIPKLALFEKQSFYCSHQCGLISVVIGANVTNLIKPMHGR